MDDILQDFVAESKELTAQLTEVLELVEEDPKLYKELEGFGQIVDRIMGSAKYLALDLPPEHPMHAIASFTELCKIIGYKASQVGNNENLTTTVAAFLLDATETLGELYDQTLADTKGGATALLSTTFLDRLRWLATKFDENLRASVAITKESAKSTQDDIDAILKQMGVGPLK
jgi:hypothetical protein